VIFVSVGTNEARFDRLLTAIAGLLLEEEVVVQHGHSARIGPQGAQFVDFLRFEEMVAYVSRARAVVTHAGVGSVMVSLANGKRPFVAPRRKEFGEAVDDHQLQLGRRFAKAGLVTLVEDLNSFDDVLRRDEHPVPTLPATNSLASDLVAFLREEIRPRAAGGS
jgi:UDP-N-acetylglucosamine transferase subunit ALG13